MVGAIVVVDAAIVVVEVRAPCVVEASVAAVGRSSVVVGPMVVDVGETVVVVRRHGDRWRRVVRRGLVGVRDQADAGQGGGDAQAR